MGSQALSAYLAEKLRVCREPAGLPARRQVARRVLLPRPPDALDSALPIEQVAGHVYERKPHARPKRANDVVLGRLCGA